MDDFFQLEARDGCSILRLVSPDGTNRLTRACVLALTETVRELAVVGTPSKPDVGLGAGVPRPLVITGNLHFFSSGAELAEIVALTGPAAYEFSLMGQALMNAVSHFPAPVCAAVSGYCMGGGLDLALACRHRVAHPHAIFGHRGSALGLITGWGGTQRLPRLVGKGRALQMFIGAEKLHATEALRIGLVDRVSEDPVAMAMQVVSLPSSAGMKALADD